jgi:hypothetical protein
MSPAHCQIHWKWEITSARGGFWVEGTLFALPDLTINFPQVVSRILFYNEMLINLDHDFKRIILGGKPQK